MEKIFNKRIRNKLILVFLIPICIIVIVFGFINYLISRKGMEDELAKRLIAIANSASGFIPIDSVVYLAPGDESTRLYKSLFTKLKKLKDLNNVKKIYVFTKENKALIDTDPNVTIGYYYTKHEFDESELSRVLAGEASTSIMFKGQDGLYYKTGYVPFFDRNNETVIIGVEGSVEFFATLRKLNTILLWLTLFSITIVILASILFSRRIVNPIKNLMSAITKIGDGDLLSKVPVQTKDEIGYLSYKFNEMRENLLERDNRMKMMLQGIAHEVRNPLGGIELFTGLLSEQVSDSAEKTQYVEKIKKETANLKNIVNDFLDYARAVNLDIHSVDMNKFFNDTALYFKTDMEKKKINYNIELKSKKRSFNIDLEYMQRVFFNLFDNAIHAMPMGGQINIRTANCASEDKNKVVCVQFSDTGIGISKENIESIFTPFFTTKAKGTGLGLAFTKKIIEEHGGGIKVESELNKGTDVFISLPC
ncbi:MAG: HAMP domain-containing sensor histidine kinase [Pseudomonadota bacterium]